MSAGLVMCSACSREVHDSHHGWTHCEDGTPLCDDGARAVFATRGEIKGTACFRDELSTRPAETGSGWVAKEKKPKAGAPKAPRSERRKRGT